MKRLHLQFLENNEIQQRCMFVLFLLIPKMATLARKRAEAEIQSANASALGNNLH